ncbi:MFS transporter, MHS family, proline/betaine transporter [Rhizobiales bacterium GAS113]|nr:MFS transporter, MHS family, proline/betaine transporter [Rhizobiales bacterium GAS113]
MSDALPRDFSSVANADAQLRRLSAKGGPTVEQSRKAIYAATIGNVMEWYDYGVFGYLAVSLAKNFFPKDDPAAALISTFAVFGVGLVVRPLGGIVIGRLGDTHGRKPALILTILLMAVGTVLIGLIPTYGSIGVLAPILLLVCRLLQGFSTGGEWGGATAFMAEWSVEGKRGFYTSLQQMSVAGGSLLGSGLAATLTSIMGSDAVDGWGWRIPFLLGGLFLPIGLRLRRAVDETPPYREVAEEYGDATAAPESSNMKLAFLAFGFTVHWTVCYYTFLSYMPTFTRNQLKLSPAESLWSNTIGLLAVVIFVPIMGALSDRIGRKPLLLASCVAFFVLPLPAFWLMLQGYGFGFIALMQVVFGLSIAFFSGAGPAAIAEIFTTRGRSTWMSSSYALAVAIFGGFAPLIAEWLIKTTGSPMAPVAYVMAAAAVSFFVILRIKETAHLPLR